MNNILKREALNLVSEIKINIKELTTTDTSRYSIEDIDKKLQAVLMLITKL